jgi:hypothetical protein
LLKYEVARNDPGTALKKSNGPRRRPEISRERVRMQYPFGPGLAEAFCENTAN